MTTKQRSALVVDPEDISNILFQSGQQVTNADNPKRDPFLGPIQVAFLPPPEASQRRQRGLIASRNVKKGELLFATPPTVEADIPKVVELWEQRRESGNAAAASTSSTQTVIEECSESVLVQAMHDAVLLQNKDTAADPILAASFSCLTGSSLSQDDVVPSMNRLNAVQAEDDSGGDPPPLTRGDCLQIVRHNAFGPDGLSSYAAMERALIESKGARRPHRLLGLYPLAAMINHSCTANAVRVFCGNNMVVHALTAIAKGQEIVWNYTPPTQPYPQRSALLQQQYQFLCQCGRCQTEASEIYQTEMVAQILERNSALLTRTATNDTAELLGRAIQVLEHEVLQFKFLSNTAKAYVRVAFLPLYTRYLNHKASAANVREKESLLLLAMHLHLSCCTAHYASTEHVSVLHWCYQAAGQMHAAAGPAQQTQTMGKVGFWTEQLKQVHMVRYGPLGHSLEHVRQIMKETRALLDNHQTTTNPTQLSVAPTIL